MQIAIDDTYGPLIKTTSTYVTENRRTHVAVIFDDHEVEFIKAQIRNCLDGIQAQFGIAVEEFHFVDIYNRNPPWDTMPNESNLIIFSFFAEICFKYQWLALIQTIDDRTLSDHNFKGFGKIDRFNLESNSDLSLLLLLCKIKLHVKDQPEALEIYIDEGMGKAGSNIGSEIFHDYQSTCSCVFVSSKKQELIQIADFIAYVINRSTHLSLKDKRTDIDNWFIQLSGCINSLDMTKVELPIDFDVNDFDDIHRKDRDNKGIETP